MDVESQAMPFHDQVWAKVNAPVDRGVVGVVEALRAGVDRGIDGDDLIEFAIVPRDIQTAGRQAISLLDNFRIPAAAIRMIISAGHLRFLAPVSPRRGLAGWRAEQDEL
jgi:hypothetical protein